MRLPARDDLQIRELGVSRQLGYEPLMQPLPHRVRTLPAGTIAPGSNYRALRLVSWVRSGHYLGIAAIQPHEVLFLHIDYGDRELAIRGRKSLQLVSVWSSCA
jgi:hypothetical protein